MIMAMGLTLSACDLSTGQTSILAPGEPDIIEFKVETRDELHVFMINSYDRRVKTLIDYETYDAGTYTVTVELTDDDGNDLETGFYFVVFESFYNDIPTQSYYVR
jgi:hypothetical protein